MERCAHRQRVAGGKLLHHMSNLTTVERHQRNRIVVRACAPGRPELAGQSGKRTTAPVRRVLRDRESLSLEIAWHNRDLKRIDRTTKDRMISGGVETAGS
jgi:hypothetical protein